MRSLLVVVFWWGQAGQHKALLYLAPAGLRVLCALAEGEQGRMWRAGRRVGAAGTAALPAAFPCLAAGQSLWDRRTATGAGGLGRALPVWFVEEVSFEVHWECQ